MSSIVKFSIFIINIFDCFINVIFKKDLRGKLYDQLQSRIKKVKINNQVIKLYAPGSILKWRADTYFTKEPETLNWIKNFKNYKIKNIILWDIGANIGLYSIYAAKVNKRIKVFSFEPSPNNYKTLGMNISINKLQKKINLITNPLHNCNQFNSFNESSLIDGSALNSFSNKLNFEGKSFEPDLSFSVLGLSLDFLVKNKLVQMPNFIKIDVDGNEHIILEGMRDLLKNLKIYEIMIEINLNYKTQYNNIIKFMSKNNFIVYKKFPASNDNAKDKFSNTFNYIFIRKEK